MAILQCSIYSKSLQRTIPVNVILPADRQDFFGNYLFEPPYKTLYLLHGIFGSSEDWMTGTRVIRWANDHGIAVVMPSGENRFYVDHPGGGENFAELIGEELVEVTRRMFPLSDKREDTYIGGLSMGGYGAIRNGLAHPETFGGIAALSSALLLDQPLPQDDCAPILIGRRSFMEGCFGRGFDELDESFDHHHLANQVLASGIPAPRIYMACGTEDPLYPLDEAFAKELDDLGYDVTWDSEPGGHEWDFWDRQIFKVLNWMDPSEAKEAVSSGHVQ